MNSYCVKYIIPRTADIAIVGSIVVLAIDEQDAKAYVRSLLDADGAQLTAERLWETTNAADVTV